MADYPISMKYTPGFNKSYSFRGEYNLLSTYNMTADGFNVTAYAFSNVDAFGAQVLCWHKDEAYKSLTAQMNSLSTSTDLSALSAWNQLSNELYSDLNSVGQKGWMSVNSRTLEPTTI